MASIDDFGGASDPLSAPAFGGPTGWAAAVRNELVSLRAATPTLDIPGWDAVPGMVRTYFGDTSAQLVPTRISFFPFIITEVGYTATRIDMQPATTATGTFKAAFAIYSTTSVLAAGTNVCDVPEQTWVSSTAQRSVTISVALPPGAYLIGGSADVATHFRGMVMQPFSGWMGNESGWNTINGMSATVASYQSPLPASVPTIGPYGLDGRSDAYAGFHTFATLRLQKA